MSEIAHQIAVGALRYFLLKFTRNAVIAFDFKEALSFQGETGPYLQYAAVRANRILSKFREAEPSFDFAQVAELRKMRLGELLNASDDIWEVVYLASRLDEIMSQVVVTLEPATLLNMRSRWRRASASSIRTIASSTENEQTDLLSDGARLCGSPYEMPGSDGHRSAQKDVTMKPPVFTDALDAKRVIDHTCNRLRCTTIQGYIRTPDLRRTSNTRIPARRRVQGPQRH